MDASMAVGGDSGNSKYLYHERQRLQFCLLHCLNNLLQGEGAFTRKELNSIADSLSAANTESISTNPLSLIFNPHRNIVTGNYDVNVLISALNSRRKEVVWFDRRKGMEGLGSEVADYGDRLLGMVVNCPKNWLLGFWQGRHWVAIRKLEGWWYNLDSNNAAPVRFVNGEDELKSYLESIIANKGEVMLVLNDAAASSEGQR